ncbi:hypothetical protein DFH28DRAFT_1080523 [Melampsora americana]|nr:hypothetical protein DFH28DRAFT_1080523 [Melampsora americana]
MLRRGPEELIKLTQIQTIQIQNLSSNHHHHQHHHQLHSNFHISTKSELGSTSRNSTLTTTTTSSSSSTSTSTSSSSSHSSEFNSESHSNHSRSNFLKPNTKIVTSPSPSSSVSHLNFNKSSTYALSDRNQSLIQKNRTKFIKSHLLDSYLTISIPTYESKPLIITEIQFGTNHPSFSIDLHHLQHLQPTLQPFVNHHSFIDRNRTFILTLFTRPTYSRSSKKSNPQKCNGHPDSSLSESDHHHPISSNHHFDPTLTWEIDFDYPKTFKKINDQDRISNQKPNQLYLETQDKVYLYRISDRSDLTHHPTGDELDGYASDDEANPRESSIDQYSQLSIPPSNPDLLNPPNQLEIIPSTRPSINPFDQASDGQTPSGSDYDRKLIKTFAVEDLIKLDEMQHRLDVLEEEEMTSQTQLQLLKTSILDRREAIRQRRERNKLARTKLSNLISTHLTSMNKTLETELIPSHQSITRSLTHTRAKLVQDLSIIYPIELSPPLSFSILKITLDPKTNSTHSSNFLKFFTSDQEEEEQKLSSALGFVVGLVKLLSSYLSIPLLYPLTWMGSRCLVTDQISLIRGTRSFPLYYKGVDRYRFEYGVFLLNKDIEQMMYHRQLTVIDIRDTLANLKNLMLTLEILVRLRVRVEVEESEDQMIWM